MLHPTARNRGPALVALWLAIAGGAVAAPGGMAAPTAAGRATTLATDFGADLRACQTAAGGRLAQRRRLEPGHPRIAACLRQRGWSPDGTPSLDRLLAPG